MQSFEEKLRKVMSASFTTQTMLANVLGVRHSVVNSWLTRGVIPRPEIVKKLCDFFKKDISFFGLKVDDLSNRPLFSQKLLNLISQNGITQTALAKRLGVTVAALNKWALGKGKPRTAVLLNLANFFDVKINYFLDDNIPIKAEKPLQKPRADGGEYLAGSAAPSVDELSDEALDLVEKLSLKGAKKLTDARLEKLEDAMQDMLTELKKLRKAKAELESEVENLTEENEALRAAGTSNFHRTIERKPQIISQEFQTKNKTKK